jgi:hypothetical protein
MDNQKVTGHVMRKLKPDHLDPLDPCPREKIQVAHPDGSANRTAWLSGFCTNVKI